ncbi:MAG: hypothetical protein JST16_16630 [Bdellovibrionales bacterium]|nr:hypothetical protein [Bdellovibrionales bacterium]
MNKQFTFLLGLGLVSSAMAAPGSFAVNTWSEALPVAIRQAKTFKLSSLPSSCMIWDRNQETNDSFTFDVREKHGGACQGDPNTSPRLFSIQIRKGDGTATADANLDREMRPLGCVVGKTTSGTGEASYNFFTVSIDGRKVFAPTSDGIQERYLYSPDYKYLAMAGSDIDLIDVKVGTSEFGIAIVNCVTGQVGGYAKGQVVTLKAWKSELYLDFTGSIRAGE